MDTRIHYAKVAPGVFEAVTTINGWNRLNIAGRTPAGSYRPAARPRAASS